MGRIMIPFTDLEVSQISFGTGEVGSSLSQEASFELLDLYLSLGGNLVDTAHSYGDWVPGIERSASEKTIGRWMKQRGNRKDIILSTKGCDPIIGDETHRSRFTREELLSDLNDSLKFLQTDYIDFYWIHKDEPDKPVDVILDVLNEEVKAGKIRYFGCSNWAVSRMQEADEYAKQHGIKSFIGDQVFWNAAVLQDLPYHSEDTKYVDEERFQYHLENKTAVFAYQSQAFGVFSRIMNGTLDEMNPGFRSFYREKETRERFDRMRKVMEDTGYGLTQVVLGYLKGQEIFTIPIVGCRKKEHLIDSMSALDIKLTAEQIRFISTGK